MNYLKAMWILHATVCGVLAGLTVVIVLELNVVNDKIFGSILFAVFWVSYILAQDTSEVEDVERRSLP